MNKKFRVRQLTAKIQQSWVADQYRKLNRRVRRKPRNNSKSVDSSRIPKLNIPKFKLPGLKLLIPAVLVFFLAIAVIAGLAKYFSINPQISELDWDGLSAELVSNKVNTMILVTQESNEYSFVDFIAVVSTDTDLEVPKAVLISPDILSPVLKKNIKLRNILSNAVAQDIPPMTAMQNAVEGVVGVKVDRYITISANDMANIFEQMSISYEARSSFADSRAGRFEEGELLSGDKLINYLVAADPGVNQRLSRQSEFVTELIQYNLGPNNLLRAVAVSNTLMDSLRSNMTRDELISFILNLSNNPQIQSSFIGASESVYSADEEAYIPDYDAIDVKIRNLLARIDVQKEQARIEIYNGTTTGGLASKTRRFVENLGGNVIRASNSPELEERSKLYVQDPERYRNNVELITQVMVNDVIQINSAYPYQHAGEIVLVVGADFAEKLD